MAYSPHPERVTNVKFLATTAEKVPINLVLQNLGKACKKSENPNFYLPP